MYFVIEKKVEVVLIAIKFSFPLRLDYCLKNLF